MASTPDAIMRTWFEEVWNQGKEETIDRLFAPNGVVHGLGPGGAPIRGPQAFRPFYHQFHKAFPDIRVNVVRTVTEGEFVAVHCHVTGTHLGDDLGAPASRNKVDFWGVCIARVSGGLVVEAWNSFDFLTCYQQAGMLPQL